VCISTLNALNLNSIVGGKWFHGALFWTSGKKFPNKTSPHGWCVGPNVTNIASDSPLWAPGKPGADTNGLNCLQFKMNTTLGKISLHDRNCSYKFSFACQVHIINNCVHTHNLQYNIQRDKRHLNQNSKYQLAQKHAIKTYEKLKISNHSLWFLYLFFASGEIS